MNETCNDDNDDELVLYICDRVTGELRSLLPLLPLASVWLTSVLLVSEGSSLQVERTTASCPPCPQHHDLLQPSILSSQFGCFSLQLIDLTR